MLLGLVERELKLRRPSPQEAVLGPKVAALVLVLNDLVRGDIFFAVGGALTLLLAGGCLQVRVKGTRLQGVISHGGVLLDILRRDVGLDEVADSPEEVDRVVCVLVVGAVGRI